MCHQTVCLVARHLEEHGIATLVVGSALDILEAGRPPRGVYVDYPLGHSVGRPFDPENQHAIIHDALDAFEAIKAPGEIRRLEYTWSDTNDWRIAATDKNTGDTRAPRDTSPQFQCDADRIAAQHSR